MDGICRHNNSFCLSVGAGVMSYMSAKRRYIHNVVQNRKFIYLILLLAISWGH